MSIYNGEKFLNRSIQSILDQTFQDFEFIIVDDGSIDDSFKIIKNYASKDNRIKVIRNLKNMGLTKSLNNALRLSRGDFIARQDGDDFFIPTHLDEHIKFLLENPDYAFCGCNGYQIQNNKDLVIYFDYNDIKKNLIIDNCFNHSGTVFRKKIFDKYGYYDEKYLLSQDYELFCRLIYKYHQKAANLKKKLIIRNMPDTRFLKKNIKKFIIQRFNCIKTKLKYLKFSQYRFKCLISILINCIEILTLSHIIGFFYKYLNRINF